MARFVYFENNDINNPVFGTHWGGDKMYDTFGDEMMS